MPELHDHDESEFHEGSESHLFREIIRTHQLLMAGFSREVGMPASRVALMRLIAIARRNVGVMDLSRQLGINPAAVTRQLKELERDGLIVRRTDASDGRRSYVTLSRKGLQVFKEIHARSHQLEREVLSVLSPADVEVAVEVLSGLRNFLEERR
ncbi:MAG TPA: MarR family transcriptional regulator [Acidobacteriota bacterium]|nr:MarR family transcriptional regulator [Acidobacteriota bacterium]